MKRNNSNNVEFSRTFEKNARVLHHQQAQRSSYNEIGEGETCRQLENRVPTEKPSDLKPPSRLGLKNQIMTEKSNSPIPLIYESLTPARNPKDSILDYLDTIERHVERLRREAAQLEEDRDTIFITLDTLRHSQALDDLSENDRDDIERYAERILQRVSTVDVSVKTVRDQVQEDALHQINKLIDNLVLDLHTDPTATRVKCLAFMNSCSSYCQSGEEDKHFESVLLGCTIDDQKRVRRRLQGLMNYIEKLSLTF